MSTNLWYEDEKDNCFIYKKPTHANNKFVIGIQIEWILEKMVSLYHNNIIVMDSTSSTNMYDVSIFKLYKFDDFLGMTEFFIFILIVVPIVHITYIWCPIKWCTFGMGYYISKIYWWYSWVNTKFIWSL